MPRHLHLNPTILKPSPSGDPLRKVIDLNPGFKWQAPDGSGKMLHITEAEIQLLSHGDHRVCDAMADADRADKRFLWHIYRLGPFEGREGMQGTTAPVIQAMINAMYKPDIERLQQGVQDLTNSFRDTTKVTCAQCGGEFDIEIDCYACGAALTTGAVFGRKEPAEQPGQQSAG